jgi:hypothetical protein
MVIAHAMYRGGPTSQIGNAGAEPREPQHIQHARGRHPAKRVPADFDVFVPEGRQQSFENVTVRRAQLMRGEHAQNRRSQRCAGNSNLICILTVQTHSQLR